MASRYYEWRLGCIHYKRVGLGDPILLVHGLYPGASGEEFDRNIGALSRNFRVYAIDLLGFGLSDAPRIRYRADLYPLLLSDFIQDVMGSPADVIAAGASGPYVATVAAERPHLVSKVVFVSPHEALPSRTGNRWQTKAAREMLRTLLLLPPLNSVFQEVMAGEWEIREMLRRSFREKARISSAEIERLCELARMPGVLHTYASLEAGLLSMPFDPVLPRVIAPAVFISGTRIDPERAARIEHLACLPQRSRLEWVDRAASWVHYDMPTQTNRIIAGFLENGFGEEIPARQQRISA